MLYENIYAVYAISAVLDSLAPERTQPMVPVEENLSTKNKSAEFMSSPSVLLDIYCRLCVHYYTQDMVNTPKLPLCVI